MGKSWPEPPTAEAYAGLADLCLAHPDFRARYEAIRPGLAEYLAVAMREFTERELKAVRKPPQVVRNGGSGCASAGLTSRKAERAAANMNNLSTLLMREGGGL